MEVIPVVLSLVAATLSLTVIAILVKSILIPYKREFRDPPPRPNLGIMGLGKEVCDVTTITLVPGGVTIEGRFELRNHYKIGEHMGYPMILDMKGNHVFTLTSPIISHGPSAPGDSLSLSCKLQMNETGDEVDRWILKK